MTKKVVLVGRPGVGKTSINSAIFQGKDPKDLMFYPLEPTRGINTSIYSWMDMEISLFDSSGQELENLLDDIEERKILFGETDLLIYVVDYIYWVTQTKTIIEEIQKISRILKGFTSQTRLIIFFHKIDLINKKLEGAFDKIKADIIKFVSVSNADVFFTSLFPNLIFKTYNALSEILSGHSPGAIRLKKVVDELIQDLPKTVCFITNQKDSIFIQSMTKDFDVGIMEHLYKKIDYLSKSTMFSFANDNSLFMIDSGSKILSCVVDKVENSNQNLKKVILLSETLGRDKIYELLNNLKKIIAEQGG